MSEKNIISILKYVWDVILQCCVSHFECTAFKKNVQGCRLHCIIIVTALFKMETCKKFRIYSGTMTIFVTQCSRLASILSHNMSVFRRLKPYQSTCSDWSVCRWRLWQRPRFQKAWTSAEDPGPQTPGAGGRWTGWRPLALLQLVRKPNTQVRLHLKKAHAFFLSMQKSNYVEHI